MRNFKINQAAASKVKARSHGICEACGFFEAVHLHHLTYARAGKELPRDLLYICTFCHCAAHPEKYNQILEWEAKRRLQVKQSRVFKETFSQSEEREREYEEGQQEREREREREEEHYRNEPAWNLREYRASGYDREAVMQEDGFLE